MFKCASVLVVLVCLSTPSIGRSWGGIHNPTYDVKYHKKSWAAETNDGILHQSNHGWGHDFGSSEESWESQDDYQDYDRRLGYVKDNDHFGYHHNHEGHHDHHNHGDDGYHHHQWPNYQEHGHHNSDSKNYYRGHHGQPGYAPPSFGLPLNNKGKSNSNVRPLNAQNPGSKPPQNSQNRDQFSRNVDRLVFPEDSQTPNLSTTRSPPVPSSSRLSTTPPVTQPPATSTTISSLVLQDILRCIRDCPATPEFNPVCGSNNVTYNNLGALECTRNCGVNVALARRSPCPQAPPPSFSFSIPTISTEQPIVNAPSVNDKNDAPIGRAAPEATSTTLPPVTVSPTRFTNIETDNDSEFNIDRRVNP